jgi:hypothetical protein
MATSRPRRVPLRAGRHRIIVVGRAEERARGQDWVWIDGHDLHGDPSLRVRVLPPPDTFLPVGPILEVRGTTLRVDGTLYLQAEQVIVRPET